MKEKKLNNFTNQMIKHMIKIKTVDLDELLLVSRSVEEHCVHVEAQRETTVESTQERMLA